MIGYVFEPIKNEQTLNNIHQNIITQK